MRPSLFATVAVLVAVSACTSTSGDPKPETTTATPTSTSGSASARPREIKLDGKDPCQLLATDQLPALKIDRPGRTRKSDFYKTTGCAWTVTGADNDLVPVTSEGVEAWEQGKRQGQADNVEPILGFPAITVTLPSDPRACDIHVDTADGQNLVAGFSVLPTYEDRFPKPCDGARALAEAAMQNLLK